MVELGLAIIGTVTVAEAGKHVMCEKPLETTVEKTDRIIRACEEARTGEPCRL